MSLPAGLFAQLFPAGLPLPSIACALCLLDVDQQQPAAAVTLAGGSLVCRDHIASAVAIGTLVAEQLHRHDPDPL